PALGFLNASGSYWCTPPASHSASRGLPWLTAYRTSSTRVEIPSLSKILIRYFLIVCSLNASSSATSRLLSPSATSATTCSSRGVSSLTPLALTTRSAGTWITVSSRYLSCSLLAQTCPLWTL